MESVIKILSHLQDVFLVVRVFGKGEKNIITFHGYGQTGEVFKRMSHLHPEYTIYSFDLFYHGESSTPTPGKPLTHDLFYHMFDQLLQKKRIDRFKLMGFSMGGKYVLSITNRYYHKIDGLYLIAPDGIEVNFWYFLATRYRIGRMAFRYIVYNPKLIFGLIRFADGIGILNKMVAKFAINEMNALEKRNRVYNSWVYLRKFFVDKKALASKLEENKIPVQIALGKYDRVIGYKNIRPLEKLLKYCCILEIESGHTHLLFKYLEGGYINR